MLLVSTWIRKRMGMSRSNMGWKVGFRLRGVRQVGEVIADAMRWTSCRIHGDARSASLPIPFMSRLQLGDELTHVLVHGLSVSLSLLLSLRNHPTRTLDCWKEAEEFKAAVAKLEAVRLILPSRLPNSTLPPPPFFLFSPQ